MSGQPLRLVSGDIIQQHPLSHTQTVIPNSGTESVVIAKKRGRKKKNETVSEPLMPINIIKNYIVQLKVKATDLEKIQRQFINKSQRIGYPGHEIHETQGSSFSKFSLFSESETKDDNSYSTRMNTLLNDDETPLIPVNHEHAEKISTKVPILYTNITIPVLPQNIPIHLFEEETHNTNEKEDQYMRTTEKLVLPLIMNNNHWPEKSPYACWNCDSYFDGTPIGIPEKEVNGYFYCHGNFCSFECVARYLSDHENTIEYLEKYSLLCLIYQKAYDYPPETKVSLAPPKQSLMKYGGKLSYEKYHTVNQRNRVIEVYQLPLIPTPIQIDEIYRSTNITNLIKNPSDASGSLKSTSINKGTKFIPIDQKKMLIAEQNIKQKNVSLIQANYSQTLDRCLQNTSQTKFI